MGTSLDSGGTDTLVTAKDVTAEADDDRFLADQSPSGEAIGRSARSAGCRPIADRSRALDSRMRCLPDPSPMATARSWDRT